MIICISPNLTPKSRYIEKAHLVLWHRRVRECEQRTQGFGRCMSGSHLSNRQWLRQSTGADIARGPSRNSDRYDFHPPCMAGQFKGAHLRVAVATRVGEAVVHQDDQVGIGKYARVEVPH